MSVSTGKCVYYECTNSRKSGARMYKIPTLDNDRMNKWIENCGNKNLLSLTQKSLHKRTICEKHFPPEAFMNDTKIRLVHDAVPISYKTLLPDNSTPQAPTSGLDTSNLQPNIESTSQKGSKKKSETDEQSTSKPTSKIRCVLVSPKQKGNPLLKSITNVPWEFDDIVPDYQMGTQTCALFLSLKYHNVHPNYIHDRLKSLGKMYNLRVLLLLIDIDNPDEALIQLGRICILADLTQMLAWSSEEAGKVIETYKIYENKPPDMIKGKSGECTYLKLIETLSSIKSINKTDAMTLISKFGTLKNIIEASEHQLSTCPGFGAKKVKMLYATLHANFCKN